MEFKKIFLKDAFLIEPSRIEDERGFFARVFCSKEFTRNGLEFSFVQCNISYNAKSGTLRGLHYQKYPYEEIKLVRCTSGVIYDVIVDVRPSSNTYLKWFGVELSAINRKMLYIPKGFLHGFITLEDETEVFYQMSEYYTPEAGQGIRFDDPDLNIKWPCQITVISQKDKNLPLYNMLPNSGS